MTGENDLRASARTGAAWGIGFTLVRDMMQFLTMLVMVRLLSPEIYGQQALAQTIIIVLAVASLKTLGQYPLQARHPEEFDWEAHFSVGATLNVVVFVLTLIVGFCMIGVGGNLVTIGQIVLVLSITFLVEIGGTYYFTWLQAHHHWARMRLLLLGGALCASVLGVTLASLGWGVFSLAAMPMLQGIPACIDLVLFSEHRPSYSFASLQRYVNGIRFGLNRAVSSVAFAGRGLAENAAMSAFFGFAPLGAFTRAIGLAQITSGRIGPVAVQTLYPVLTRAEAKSERFRRFSTLLLQGALWLSLPAAAFLAIESSSIVLLLYGHRWENVVPLLPIAAFLVATRGLSTVLNQILLANLQLNDCLRIDLATAVAGFFAIILAMPFGAVPYLLALLACDALFSLIMMYVAVGGGAINLRPLVGIAVPCFAASLGASAITVVIALSSASLNPTWSSLFTHVLAQSAAFAISYAVTLCVIAPVATADLIDALPIPAKLRTIIAPVIGRRGKAARE
jgi:O-antigen/teichoic acid export membrane protein